MVYLQQTSKTMKLVPLVCLCLVTRSGITFADENGPVVVKEDSDVVLPCSLSSKENIESKLFDWKKDGHMEVFMYDGGLIYGKGISGQDKQFEGRVSHFGDALKNGNASIKISKTKVSDSGNYSCIFPRHQPSQTFNIQLVVDVILKDRSEENIPGAAPKPIVTIIKTDSGALLQCEVSGASPEPKVEWRDSSGKILPAKEPQVTERGGSYDIILQTAVSRADTFRCVVTQEEINHQTEAEIYVPLNGAASEPSVTNLNQTKDQSLLQCVIRGASPKPKVEWRDSSGQILPAKEPKVTERGGSYDIILQTTVTKTDHYSCVVTQEEINHQTEGKIHVFMNDSESLTGWIVAAILGSLFILVFIAGVILSATGHIRLICNKDEEKRETIKETESGLLPP